ncbi:MAG: sensor histidine kinase [Candidatus Acidulodesulfobacterium sp.]
MHYNIISIFYILILSLFLFFLYIFLFKNIQSLFAKNKLKEYIREIDNYKTVLNKIAEGVAVINKEKEILFVNESFGRNIRSVKTDGKNINIRFDFLTRNIELNSLIDEAVQNSLFKNAEKKIFYYDRAEKKTANCVIFKINDKDKYAVIVKDVTDIQKVEDIRSSFIQNVSHELQTPVTAITGFAETLKNGAIDNPSVRMKFVNIIEQHAKRLRFLIDDLITLSNIETEKFPVKLENIDIKANIENSLILFEREIKEKNLSFINKAKNDIFISDPGKISLIINNLIHNAVKYGNKNGTAIIIIEGYTCSRSAAMNFLSDTEETSVLWNFYFPCEDDPQFLFFSISDNGIGVNYTNLLRLGERFFRIDGTHKNSAKGSGLGLAIVKHTLKLLRGSAVIKSSMGNGFKFSFIIPVKTAKQNLNRE